LLASLSVIVLCGLGLAATPAGATPLDHPRRAHPVPVTAAGVRRSSAALAPLNMASVSVADKASGSFVYQESPGSVAANPLATSLPGQVSMSFGSDGGILISTSPAPIQAGQVYTTSRTVITVTADGHSCGTDSNLGQDTATVVMDQFTTSPSSPTPVTLALQFTCDDPKFTISASIAYNIVPTTPGQGYYLHTDEGAMTGFGNDNYLAYLGDLSLSTLNKPIVGMAITPDGGGYWMVASDGGIFTFGDAQFYGSTGAIRLNKPIVGMAVTPSGHGYWMVASDGGIFSFGDAQFYGSTGAIHLNKPIVGMAATPTGHGYWMVASDGGIFTFGDGQFYGSTGAIRLNKPIVGMAATPTGHGYWMVASDGGIFTFGDGQFYGSLGGTGTTNAVGIAVG